MEFNYNTYDNIYESIQFTYEKLKKTTDQYGIILLPKECDIMARFNVVLPYYIDELKDTSFYRKIVDTKGTLTRSLYAFPIIKTLLHLRLFTLDLEKADEVYRIGLRCNNEIHLANEILCFDILFTIYNLAPYSKAAICEQHILLTRDTFINYLYRFMNAIHNISIDYIDAIIQQIDMIHKNITAQLTEMLLNRTGFFAYIRMYMPSFGIIGLLSIDIDHFKQVNDYMGHSAGDECLIKIGNILGEVSEKYGGVGARAGGEEFFMAFPGVDENTLNEITDEINLLLHKIERKIPEGCTDYLPYMSASIGAGLWSQTELPYEENLFKRLFDQLDKAVYKSKEVRNRTTVISFVQ